MLRYYYCALNLRCIVVRARLATAASINHTHQIKQPSAGETENSLDGQDT